VRGQPVQVWHGHNGAWHQAIVLQVNDRGESCDVLYQEDEEIELNVDCALVRPLQTTATDGQHESAEGVSGDHTSTTAAPSELNSNPDGETIQHLGAEFFSRESASDSPPPRGTHHAGPSTGHQHHHRHGGGGSGGAPAVMMMSASSLAIRAADSVWSPVFSAGSVGTRGSVQMSRTLGLPSFGAAAAAGEHPSGGWRLGTGTSVTVCL
jgi:hypothetical protein